MKKRIISIILSAALIVANMNVLEIKAADTEPMVEVNAVTLDCPEVEEEGEWKCIDGVIYVPEGITRIEDEGLRYIGNEGWFPDAKSIVLPSTLEYIGNRAFEMCELEEIVIPGNVKEIGNSAFGGCDNLKKVIIEDGVEKIGYCLFCNCENLETVVMPKSVKDWDTSSAFMWCYSLKNITLPEKGMDTMGTGMFYSCKALEELIIPDCVTTMNYGVISGCDNLKLLKVGYNVVNFEEEEGPYPYEEVNFTLGCFGFNKNFVLEAPVDSAIVEYARYYRYFTVKYDYPDFERVEWICDGKIPEDETSKWIDIKFQYKSYPENTRTGGRTQIDLTENVLQKDGYSCVWISSTQIEVAWAADGRGVPAVHYFSETYTTQDENLEFTVEHTDFFRITVTKASLAEKRVQIEILTAGTWDGEDAQWELITPAIDTSVLTPTPVPTAPPNVTPESDKDTAEVPGKPESGEQQTPAPEVRVTVTPTMTATPTPENKAVKPAKVNLKTVKQLTTKKRGKKVYTKSVKITWKKTKNADGYVVYMKSGKGKYKTLKTITNGKTVSYTKKNLKKGKIYCFKVKAYRKVNGQKVYGSYSGVKKVKIK